jgi:hypothetical protein
MTAAGFDEFGWGSVETDGDSSWNAAASGALVVATGIYWTMVWVVGGLAPLGHLAARRSDARQTIRVAEQDGEPS